MLLVPSGVGGFSVSYEVYEIYHQLQTTTNQAERGRARARERAKERGRERERSERPDGVIHVLEDLLFKVHLEVYLSVLGHQFLFFCLCTFYEFVSLSLHHVCVCVRIHLVCACKRF